MKNKIIFLFICTIFSLSTSAQRDRMTREEKDEKNAARTARINSKNDYANFRKAILGLKEYDAERQLIPAVRKTTKMNVKVTAYIDSSDNDAEGTSKTLVGYIKQDVGDNSTNRYEIIYDRTLKKITSVKRTQEAIDADKELTEEAANKATPKKPGTKATPKKKNPDDEDDEEEEPKPTKAKQKPKDDDN